MVKVIKTTYKNIPKLRVSLDNELYEIEDFKSLDNAYELMLKTIIETKYKIMTTNKLANKLGISRTSLYRYMKKFKINTSKYGQYLTKLRNNVNNF